MSAPDAIAPAHPRLYLDHAASSALRPEVRDAMAPWWGASYGNAASSHQEGRAAKAALKEARARIAELVGAKAEEVVLTSGATEASNLAIRGAAHIRRNGGRRIASTLIEHAATRRACKLLATEGWDVHFLPVDETGRVQLDGAALPHGTSVLSVIAGHNELGTLQPLQALAEAAHAVGALLHLDAVQTAGYVELAGIEWDLLSLSAHKLGGPQGVGALIRRGTPPLTPVMVGGAQEDGLRPGTVPIALAVGFGAAAEAARERRAEEARRLATLRDLVKLSLCERLPMLRPLGALAAGQETLPQILSLAVPGVRGDELVYALDQVGVAASSASACLSGARSHVLETIGVPDEVGALRLSFGWNNEEEAVLAAVPRMVAALTRLSAQAPFERRKGILAQTAEGAGVRMGPAHWEAAEAVYSYYLEEGILPGPRKLARVLGPDMPLDRLYPYGLATLAVWLGLPAPRGGCRPYAG